MLPLTVKYRFEMGEHPEEQLDETIGFYLRKIKDLPYRPFLMQALDLGWHRRAAQILLACRLSEDEATQFLGIWSFFNGEDKDGWDYDWDNLFDDKLYEVTHG